MEQDGHLKSLAERMKEKAEQERIETEKVFTEQLQTLSSSLQESSKNVLRTISDAMAMEATNLQKDVTAHYRILSFAFGRKWICLAALGTALCLGMLAGGWTLAKAGTWHLKTYRDELAALKREIATQRETLTEMTTETWGLELRTLETGRYIVLPEGKKPGDKIWLVDGLYAVKVED